MCIVLFDEVGVPLGMGEGFVGGSVWVSIWGSGRIFIVGVGEFVVGYLGQSLFGILLRGSMG